MIGRLLSAVFLGTLRFVFYMLVGMMVLIRGRRKTAAALVDNGYADNDTLWRRIQVLKVELMQKEQQLEAVKRVNGVYVGEQIPALRAELQEKDQLLEKFQRVDAKGKTDAATDLHNKLKESEKLIKSLKSASGDAAKTIQRLERQMQKKDKDLVLARESHLATGSQLQDLLAQIQQKDDLISSLKFDYSGSRLFDALKQQIFEQAKVIEGMRSGIGVPSNDDKVKILQKELKDQDAAIASLQRRLRLGGKSWWSKGGQVLDVMFFPDKSKDVLPRFLEYFRAAKSSVEICVFTITSNDIADEVLRAHERGVRIRIISDDDQMSTRGSDVQRLKDAGIPVRHDNSRYYMHHKFCIFDEKLLANGSFNWSRQAVMYNYENIVIYDDRELVKEFHQKFQELWGSFVE